MKKKSILQSYIVAASVLLMTVVLIVWYSTDRFHQFFIQQLEASLNARAITVYEGIDEQAIKLKNCNVLKNSDPSTRVTIVNKLGKVLCDSEANPVDMDNHLTRPEVKKALEISSASVIRFSHTLQHTMLYVAIKKHIRKNDIIIRTAIPLLEIESLLNELYIQFYLVMFILLVIIGIIMWFIYSKINRPLSQIVVNANLIAQGRFDAKTPEYEIKEIEQIGGALNNMTNQLGRLENLRKDFVGNVSHELKTPIATIQSYVETLLDGAMHEEQNAKRFLNIVLKQNNRLGHIVDDLLMLSRLENTPRSELLRVHSLKVKELFQASKELCLERAEKKGIKIKIKSDTMISIQVDQSLMLQALVNLIDNAIKYSETGEKIHLIAEQQGQTVNIIVSDKGPGIEEHHFHRLFERFYRTDKSRSRQKGGTGLGLAIVKHIVQIHDANIEVKNNDNGGCRFIIKFTNN